MLVGTVAGVKKKVVVLDYGSGNLRSAERALARVGADVEVTSDFGTAFDADGAPRVYAPHGYDDLFALVVRPNRRLAPRDVYEAKAARWLGEWPELTVLPWDG